MFGKRAFLIVFISLSGIMQSKINCNTIVKTVSPNHLKALLDNNDVSLIDVREPAEYRSKHIDGSILIPLSGISSEKIPTKSSHIVLYCQSGRRSLDGCLKLLSQDSFLDVASLDGGIVAWEQAGFSVKKNDSTILPLDRQTHLAAGLLAFSGTILGATVNPLFYIVPGFVGMGLMVAGITGWCGMALLLAKMPWNQ